MLDRAARSRHGGQRRVNHRYAGPRHVPRRAHRPIRARLTAVALGALAVAPSLLTASSGPPPEVGRWVGPPPPARVLVVGATTDRLDLRVHDSPDDHLRGLTRVGAPGVRSHGAPGAMARLIAARQAAQRALAERTRAAAATRCPGRS